MKQGRKSLGVPFGKIAPVSAVALLLALAACDNSSDEAAMQEPSPPAGETVAVEQAPPAGTETASADAGAQAPTPGVDSRALSPAQIDRVRAFAAAWPAEVDFLVSFDALDPNVRITDVRAAAARFDPTDEYHGLPRTEGYDLVDAYCTACHSLRIVMQQHATEERWDYLLTWMTEEQGMPALEESEREVVLDYLVENFGATMQEGAPG